MAATFNRIINGAMTIDQRNAGAAVTITNTGALTYTADRWGAYGSAASKFTVQQSTTAPDGFSNSIVATSSSAYSVGTSEIFKITQMVEGFNSVDLSFGNSSAKTITISFWVRSSLTGTFGGAVLNSNFNRSYPFSYTIFSSNTWEKKTVTIAGDTTGTWVGSTNGIGLQVIWSLGAGSGISDIAGSWVSANKQSATGATSVVGTSGATFYITGVQLEAGSFGSSFAHENYGDTLRKCQRYYSTGITGAGSRFGDNYYVSNGQHKVTLRATPTIVMSSGPNGYYLANQDGFVSYTAGGSSGALYVTYTASAEL